MRSCVACIELLNNSLADTTIKTRHMHQSTSSAHLKTEEDLNKLFELFSTVFPSLSDVPPTFLIDAVAANHCALVFVTAARCPHLVYILFNNVLTTLYI